MKEGGDELIRTAYARETRDAPVLYEGMNLADIAHVVGLVESKIVPEEAAGELLSVLLAIHPAPPLDLGIDPARGDLYQNREAFISMMTPAVGFLSAGRARREATTIGYRIAVRTRLLTLSRRIEDFVSALVDRAEEHRTTLFPDYTYLQPAQPTVFGHYLLTFAYPALRDLTRVRTVFAHANQSPAGSGSVNGSRLPLDRERLARLLGFDGVVPHTRDAMWQADGPIELTALLSSVLVNVDRLAEDLQIFSTAEFDLVTLADAHTRRSIIMPQKRNPYALAYLRGVASEAIGTMTAMAAVGRTPSGQIDNRIFAYGDVPRGIDTAVDALALAAAVVSGLSVHASSALRRVGEHFVGATDLADVLLQKTGVDYRKAHRLVREAIAKAPEGKIDPAAFESLGLSREEVVRSLDPASIVATRTGRGGASEPSMMEMIGECRDRIAEQESWRREIQGRLHQASQDLLSRASELAGDARPGREKEFTELPEIPEWRRRRRKLDVD